MGKYTIAYYKQYIIDALSIQLFVTLISLPVFVAWGIPLSLFSILGNMLFSPVLTVYIFVCSLIFVSSLLTIPCTPLIYLLDHISTIWLLVIDYVPATLQIGIAKPHPLILIAIALITLFVLHIKTLSKQKKCIFYAVFFAMIITISQIQKHTLTTMIDIPCFNGSVHLITANNSLTIIDPGYIGQRISAPSWAEYTLLATITKLTGHTIIDKIIIMQPNRFACNALEALCKRSAIKTIYIPFWSTTHNPSLNAAFSALKESAQTYGCTIIRFGSHQNHRINEHTMITLTSHDTCQIIKRDTVFPCSHVHGIIDNKPFSFYASKHKKHKTLSASS